MARRELRAAAVSSASPSQKSETVMKTRGVATSGVTMTTHSSFRGRNNLTGALKVESFMPSCKKIKKIKVEPLDNFISFNDNRSLCLDLEMLLLCFQIIAARCKIPKVHYYSAAL